MISLGRELFRLGFEVSPIILTGGIASSIPGGMLPIITITEAASFVTDLLNGSVDDTLDNFFAHYRPLPGSSLVDNDIGQYPFANQTVAANATIANPLTISLQMICPVRKAGGYTAKLIAFTALTQVLAMHTAQGGLYTVATPAQIYTNLILRKLHDVSAGQSAQAQHTYQWDFEQPLVTFSAAASAQNSLMSKLSSGTQISGDPTWSGAQTAVGSTLSGAVSTTVTGAQNLTGTLTGAASGVTASAVPSGSSIVTSLP